MKRLVTPLFYAVIGALFFAGVAQSATVFDQDGFTYKIKGDLQVQLRQDVGDDQNLDVEYDDLELKNSVEYDLGNGLSAFGQLDFGFKDAAEDDAPGPELEEAYLGFAYDKFSILVGKTDSSADEFGIEGTIEGNNCETYAFPEDNGDDLIRAEADFDVVKVVVAHEIKAEGEDSENGSFTDIFVGAEFVGFEVGAAYQTYKDDSSDDSTNTYGVSLAYDAKVVYVGADYSLADNKEDNEELTVWNVFVSVPVMDTTKIGAGYIFNELDSDNASDDYELEGWYVNAAYKFPKQKNVSVFAEVADDDGEDSDMGYLVGMRVKF